MRLRFWILITLAASLPACVQWQLAPTGGNACLRHFQAWDVRIDQRGVRHAGAHRPAGFPWLRASRFTASLQDGLRTDPQWAAWLEQMRRLDLQARRSELRNVGAEQPQREWQRLASCGRQLNAVLLADADARRRLLDAAAVPDDYSILQRLFGMYPLALPFLQAGISAYQAAVTAGYQQPLAALPVTGQLRLWQPRTSNMPPVALARLPRDALGIPQLKTADWQALAAQHAPAWWIDTATDDDLPGAPLLTAQGPDVDSTRPSVYFRGAWTQFNGQVLPQLVYLMWFRARTPAGSFDPYAGRLDAVIWRVTLAADGQPLFYDSIHACGCYHRVYPTARVQPRAAIQQFEEPILMPQHPVPAPPLVLRLAAGTHHLQRVLAADAVRNAAAQPYTLRAYAELHSLPLPGGGRASLFADSGLVPGTQRAERWWLWPSGVVSPGAMRQWGRHAIAFAGMRHFDDPSLPDQWFAPVTPQKVDE